MPIFLFFSIKEVEKYINQIRDHSMKAGLLIVMGKDSLEGSEWSVCLTILTFDIPLANRGWLTLQFLRRCTLILGEIGLKIMAKMGI